MRREDLRDLTLTVVRRLVADRDMICLDQVLELYGICPSDIDVAEELD